MFFSVLFCHPKSARCCHHLQGNLAAASAATACVVFVRHQPNHCQTPAAPTRTPDAAAAACTCMHFTECRRTTPCTHAAVQQPRNSAAHAVLPLCMKLHAFETVLPVCNARSFTPAPGGFIRPLMLDLSFLPRENGPPSSNPDYEELRRQKFAKFEMQCSKVGLVYEQQSNTSGNSAG